MNREVKKKTLLLGENGRLKKKGYARKMNFVYNRRKVRKPWRLKEWDFYQFIKDHYALQLTIGHVTYMCSVTATLMDLDTGERWEIGCMKPLYIPKLDQNPEKESYVSFQSRDMRMSFQVTKDQRLLIVRGESKKFGTVDIRLEVENDPDNEKMVIATPFVHYSTYFYLNYKENYYKATGWAKFGEKQVDLQGATGLIDWGRGVWPYRHEWYWGNLTSELEGVPFGFNIGWGFGDLSYGTENMFFYNKKAYKLGQLLVIRDEENYMAPWRLQDEDGLMELTFTPMFDNYTENRFVVVDTHCHQLYGYFDGYIYTNEGKKDFSGKLAFIEHAVNKW